MLRLASKPDARRDRDFDHGCIAAHRAIFQLVHLSQCKVFRANHVDARIDHQLAKEDVLEIVTGGPLTDRGVQAEVRIASCPG